MTQKTYHGDPNYGHYFRVYPKNERLVNSQWDTYDPTDLCNNFTYFDINPSNQIRTYKCNGHPK
jgi:hypothetical protein